MAAAQSSRDAAMAPALIRLKASMYSQTPIHCSKSCKETLKVLNLRTPSRAFLLAVCVIALAISSRYAMGMPWAESVYRGSPR